MRAALVIAALLAGSSVAKASEARELVALFSDVCMVEGQAFNSAGLLAQSRGWSRDDEMSGEQSKMPGQSILGKVWNIERTGLPSRAVKVHLIKDRNGTAETCTISQIDYRSAETEASLRELLHLAEPSERDPRTVYASTNWILNADPYDFIHLGEQTVREHDLTQIVRARAFFAEKP